MQTVFKFNRGIITHTSRSNLAEGLDLKKPIKVPMPDKSLYANLQDVCVAL